ncbi:MAG: N-acetylmuramoyl-L-alanine amidase [Acidobacteriales bacterium]|nr:N-acetylmuramoyl-L-alanine amidase [Terriglobales bacterium]
MTRLRLKLLATALLPALLWTSPAFAVKKRSVAQKKQIARSHFDQAERLREALKGKPERARTRAEYTRVIDAYRKVYYTAPTSNRADISALTVADLMVEYGRRFDDQKSFNDAIAQYQFLRREYPGSRYRMEALFTIGQIYHDDLNDNAKARDVFQEVIKRYPSHELAEQAKETLQEIADEEKAAKSGKKTAKKKEVAKKSAPEPKKPEPEESDSDEEPAPAPPQVVKEIAAPVKGDTPVRTRLPLLTSVRHWSTPDYTRVAIDLEDEVKYEVGRVGDPDRIFFDLHDTKLATELVGKSFDVGDGFLRKIRVAQYTLTSARVVLEVDNLAEYSAFILPNPYRLIIDVRGKPASQTQVADEKSGKPAETAPTKSMPAKPEESKPVTTAKAGPDPTKELVEADSPLNKELERKSKEAPTSLPTSEVVTPRTAKPSKKGKPAPAENAGVGKEAKPLTNGDRSLIRALGLKIGRIVVDAGHGGHDTGTIGPNGLMEKDLVLDVALRLGKLLEGKLGAEVVYTRDDDTFIPLESRTAIANKQQADLFISIHANSSDDPKARGVETYYLNFTSNAEALEVAARENAVSQKSVFELQDLVKKIALKEKIDESAEFASDVQHALFAGLANKNPGMKNRGVKKAPFVVLIGANMPSILAEVSFVSNPSDEKKLKTADHRQRIADSLFKGISRYANGLSGVKAAGRLAENTTASTAP